jgi:hypothetical protein
MPEYFGNYLLNMKAPARNIIRLFRLGPIFLIIKAGVNELYFRMKLQADWIRYGSKYKKSACSLRKEVCVSLTSYPARFGTLHLTLKSLLTQSVQPKEIILWIAHDEMKLLPKKVLALQQYGLSIKGSEDLKSYTKLIPFLREKRNTPVATADDDVYYWRDWLKELILAQVPGKAEIVCHRMHRIRLSQEGVPLPYKAWEYESAATENSIFNFPTGVLGVLYPPNIFHTEVLDMQTALDLCPLGDDIWFYWMARLNKAPIRRVKKSPSIYCWRSSRDVALSIKNTRDGFNDVQIASMVRRYGYFGINWNSNDREFSGSMLSENIEVSTQNY